MLNSYKWDWIGMDGPLLWALLCSANKQTAPINHNNHHHGLRKRFPYNWRAYATATAEAE